MALDPDINEAIALYHSRIPLRSRDRVVAHFGQERAHFLLAQLDALNGEIDDALRKWGPEREKLDFDELIASLKRPQSRKGKSPTHFDAGSAALMTLAIVAAKHPELHGESIRLLRNNLAYVLSK